MKESRFSEEQRVASLREAERTSVPETAKKHGVSEPTVYAWRKRFGAMDANDVTRSGPSPPSLTPGTRSVPVPITVALVFALQLLSVATERTPEHVGMGTGLRIRCGIRQGHRREHQRTHPVGLLAGQVADDLLGQVRCHAKIGGDHPAHGVGLKDGAAQLRVAHRLTIGTWNRGRGTGWKDGIADRPRSAIEQTGQPRGDISHDASASGALGRAGRQGGEAQAAVTAGAGLLLEPIDLGIATCRRGNVPTQPSTGRLLPRVVGDIEGSTPPPDNHDITMQLPHRRLEAGPEIGALCLGASVIGVEVDVIAAAPHRRAPEGHHPSNATGAIDRGEASRSGVVLVVVILDTVCHQDVAGGGAQTARSLGQGLDRAINGILLVAHQTFRQCLREQLTGDIRDRALLLHRLLHCGLENPA
ncbi:transposase [Corallococcus sp. M34]|nr:transposase [Citreicoccus inhibens]